MKQMSLPQRKCWEYLDQKRLMIGGLLTQSQAQTLAASSYVTRRAREIQCSAADLFWAWAAEKAVEVTRRERGHHSLVVPAGGALATARVMKEGVSEAWDTTMMGRVARALEESSLEQGEMESESDCEEEPVIQLTAEVVAAAWQKIKGSFKGEGGYSRFREYMVGGMLQGLCEGSVEEDPTEGTWWRSAVEKVKSQGAAPQDQSGSFRRQTRVPSSVGLRVGLDFGAGTQSARPLVEQCGFLYIPIDIKRWVYSARLGEWVENVVLDLSEGTGEPEDMWSRIRQAVLEQWNLALGAQLVTVGMIWMSPLCRTFSNADASNRLKGWGYRDHRIFCRPPLQAASNKYGLRARQDDLLVQLWIRLAVLWSHACPGLVWFLENPVGSLERRPYMAQYSEGLDSVVRTVHYCAYGRPYKKPTRIWTNMMWWVPMGRTGQGQCLGEGHCSQMVGTRHLNSAAGGGRRVGGKGSVAGKSAVPDELMRELVEAVQWRVGSGRLVPL
jgi:hypothetical protein